MKLGTVGFGGITFTSRAIPLTLSLSPLHPLFSPRPSLLLPNCLAMMETLEDAPEPFFGKMSVDPRLPSPFDIPQVGFTPLGPLRNHEITA